MMSSVLKRSVSSRKLAFHSYFVGSATLLMKLEVTGLVILFGDRCLCRDTEIRLEWLQILLTPSRHWVMFMIA
jgi:hypothetical protein